VGPALSDVGPTVGTGLTTAELRASLQDRPVNSRLVSVTIASARDEPRYTAVWASAGRDEQEHLWLGDSVPMAEFRAVAERAIADGAAPRHVSVWQRRGEPWVTAVWGPIDDGEEITLVYRSPVQELDATKQSAEEHGAGLAQICGYQDGGDDYFLTVWSTSRGQHGELLLAKGDESAVEAVEQATRDNRPIVAIDRWGDANKAQRWVVMMGDGPGDSDVENLPIAGLLTPQVPISLFSGVAAGFGHLIFLTKEIPDTYFRSTDWFRMSNGVAVFMSDNPQIATDVELTYVDVKGGGRAPQEITSSRSSWAVANGQLGMTVSQPGPNGPDVQDREIQPIGAATWTAPAKVPVSLERLSLGYQVTTVDVWIRNPDYSQLRQRFRARLDSDVLMVPVEVAYFRTKGRTDDYRERFRAVLDGESTLGDAWTSASEGQIRYSARQWKQRAPNQFWGETSGLESPDSIFRRARICFRMRSYEVFDVERKLSAPQTGEFSSDDSAFSLNSNTLFLATNDRPPALRVLLMANVAPPESKVEGTTIGSSAGISIGTFETLVLAHEIAHVAGLDHVRDPKNLMYTEPSATGLTDWQIQKLRGWASKFRSQWP